MAQIKGKKVYGAAGSTLSFISYQGRQYFKTTNVSGTASTYKYLGTGSDLTEVSASTENTKHEQEILVSEEHYITDQLGNKYHLAFLPIYDIDETDGNGKPSLVGRAPGGKFGGK